jgi:hypothetical protein
MAATNRPAAAEKRAPTRRAPAKPKPDPAKTAEPETELGGEGAAPPADIVAADALTITTTPWIPSRRVVIFYVDGKPYSVPETPPANWALNYMDAIRRHGELIASTWLMETMLGTEGYNVLRSNRDMTDEQLAQVVVKIQDQLGKGPKEQS